jgi:tRNA A-37 threonylcarbamoyl transferase component Bud32/putative methionine-R-sulfoxide reductase with GAF domain
MELAAEEDLLASGDAIAGRYIVEGAISRGAMGAVYRARDEEGRRVAVKRLVDRRQAARFEIEARLLTRLRHPRVVRVLEHLQDETGKYLVMELIEGSDLAAVLRARGSPGLPVSEALDYARHACQALQYVHEQQVVHRDVKPQNLILGRDGVVLVDFGIAREAEREDPGTRAIGTPLYMAPEVLVGEGVSPRSDVYGVGATLWALITGAPPAYHDQTRLAGVMEGVTPELERTLRAALELQPERRIASVEALAAGLGSPLGAAGGESLALSLPHPPARRDLLESIVRTAAGIFGAAAASIALVDEATGELVYQAAWGAGADEILGVRLPPGEGIAGAVVATGRAEAVADCRRAARFAAAVAERTGYVPYTMLVAPLREDGRTIGVLSVLDRRDARGYTADDLGPAELFAELIITALSRAGRPGAA